MINHLFSGIDFGILAFVGIMIAFFATILLMWKGTGVLPKDIGREFAHDGKLSAGKPRGAGFLFVLVFIVTAFLFGKMNVENAIYLILVLAAMMTGFLDDCAKTPWGELKKGILDLVIAVMLAVTYLNFNTNKIYFASCNKVVALPEILFGVLIVILVWTSINVTNCSDGVDGLSGTLTIITLATIYVISILLETASSFTYLILLFIICILGYLWFNATPSQLLMGDAGSRAMGLFIAVAVLKSGVPVLYLLVAAVLILDGGLGLLKVALLRFLKIRIMKNIRTPLHDHVRKVWNWSNTHTVYRFSIIQLVLSVLAIFLVIY